MPHEELTNAVNLIMELRGHVALDPPERNTEEVSTEIVEDYCDLILEAVEKHNEQLDD